MLAQIKLVEDTYETDVNTVNKSESEINRNVSGFISRKAVSEYLKEGKQKKDKKEK